MDELKPWACVNGHIMGQVKRNRSGVRQLLLYRHAVDLDAEKPENVDLIGHLEGTMFDIRCDLCGAVRTWQIGKEAVEKPRETYVPE